MSEFPKDQDEMMKYIIKLGYDSYSLEDKIYILDLILDDPLIDDYIKANGTKKAIQWLRRQL